MAKRDRAMNSYATSYAQAHINGERLMKSFEVCEYLQISRTSLYRYMNDLGLPYLDIPGGARRFRRVEIDQWLDDQRDKR